MNSNDRYEVSRMTLIIFSAMQTYLLPNNSLLKMLSWARTKRWKPTKKKTHQEDEKKCCKIIALFSLL